MHSPNPKNSNWLNRLRSSKGFPISTNHDSLDQFLTPNLNPIQPPPSKPPNSKKDNHCHNLIHFLFDLFIMPNPSFSSSSSNPTSLRKSARKQPHPRSYNRASSQSSANNNNGGKQQKLKASGKKVGVGGGGDELLGFSRTEVTVIDTSLLPEWKAVRVAYRKGNAWKVKERNRVRVRRKKKKMKKKKKRKMEMVEKLGGEKKRERNEK